MAPGKWITIPLSEIRSAPVQEILSATVNWPVRDLSALIIYYLIIIFIMHVLYSRCMLITSTSCSISPIEHHREKSSPYKNIHRKSENNNSSCIALVFNEFTLHLHSPVNLVVARVALSLIPIEYV